MTFGKTTDCPICKDEQCFSPARFHDKFGSPLIRGGITANPFHQGGNGGISLGSPAIDLVFKNCTSCGYVAVFSVMVLEHLGEDLT